MNKACYLFISADKRMNHFMVAADLFENGKVLGQIEEVTVNYKDGEEVTMELAGKVVREFESVDTKDVLISFVHLIRIVVDNKVIFNNGEVKPYWNKQVRIISTGKKWFMLHEFVKNLGFKVETDEFLYITSIS